MSEQNKDKIVTPIKFKMKLTNTTVAVALNDMKAETEKAYQVLKVKESLIQAFRESIQHNLADAGITNVRFELTSHFYEFMWMYNLEFSNSYIFLKGSDPDDIRYYVLGTVAVEDDITAVKMSIAIVKLGEKTATYFSGHSWEQLPAEHAEEFKGLVSLIEEEQDEEYEDFNYGFDDEEDEDPREIMLEILTHDDYLDPDSKRAKKLLTPYQGLLNLQARFSESLVVDEDPSGLIPVLVPNDPFLIGVAIAADGDKFAVYQMMTWLDRMLLEGDLDEESDFAEMDSRADKYDKDDNERFEKIAGGLSSEQIGEFVNRYMNEFSPSPRLIVPLSADFAVVINAGTKKLDVEVRHILDYLPKNASEKMKKRAREYADFFAKGNVRE